MMATTMHGRVWRLAVVAWAAVVVVGCGDDASPAGADAIQDVTLDAGGESDAQLDTAGPDTKWRGKCIQGPGFCDDGNPCTEDDCLANVGCVSTPKQCADDDPCTIDSCDIGNGKCKHESNSCDDGNACTTGSCDGEQGCVYQAVDCSDGDACTADGCSPLKGCLNTPLDCDDGVTCSVDSCQPDKGCVHEKPDGKKCCESATDCEDGNVCTAHTCEAGVCATEAVLGCCAKADDCDDGNPCTADACALATGQCSNTFKPGPGCCQSDSNCQDFDPCTSDVCVKGQCGHEVVCCDQVSDCEASPAVGLCGQATCTSKGCGVQTKPDANCCVPGLAAQGFEETGGWNYALSGSKKGVWKVQTTGLSTAAKTSQAGVGAATFQATAADLPGGGAVARMVMDTIELPPGRKVTLEFWYRAYLLGGSLGDTFRVRLETPVGAWYVWQAPSTSTSFKKVAIDLRGFSGRAATRKVDVVFEIKPNQVGSTYTRVWLDGLQVNSDCQSVNQCSNDSQCADGLAATDEVCSPEGVCVYKTSGMYCEQATACNDKNACTSDACNNFGCTNKEVANCCTSSTQCADNNPCTTDVCSGLKCTYVTKPASVCCNQAKDCDDGNPCTIDQCPAVGLPCAHTQTDSTCCVSSGDCDDQDNCTLDVCSANKCVYKNQCCKQDSDCDDQDNLCTVDKCVAGKCDWQPTNAAGCCEPKVFERTFEDGQLDGLVLKSSATDVKWQLVTGKKANSGKSALYYGNLAANNYDAKNASGGSVTNDGSVTAQGLKVPSDEETTLSFALWMQTEQGTSYDKFEVWVDSGATKTKVWDKTAQGFAISKWQDWKVNLSAWAGKEIDLRFVFNTTDQIANGTEGVYLDDITLQRACSKLTCNQAADCDDGLPATKDSCAAGACVYTF